MRLCLDEHYSSEIALQLRDAHGHDVYAVKERPGLVGLSDIELWSRVQGERRTLLTENVHDFEPIRKQAEAVGEMHYGIVYSSSRSMPRSRNTIGLFVERLRELMDANQGDDDFIDRTHWLSP